MMDMTAKTKNHYTVECYGADGQLKWRDEFDNLVVTAGLNKLLDATIKTGLSSPAWYVGLINGANPTLAGSDTMASKGWTEAVPYSDGTRPAFTAGTISAGAVSNSASKAVFNINSGATVGGAFLAYSSTKSETASTLYGEGLINGATGRAVISGDTLNVQIDLSIS